MKYTVNFDYDDEANVWTATSLDIPGLVLECGSLDALQEKVRFAVVELLQLNSQIKQQEKINLLFLIKKARGCCTLWLNMKS